MAENYDYTIEEIMEKAKNDPEWEPDPEKREILVNQLRTALAHV